MQGIMDGLPRHAELPRDRGEREPLGAEALHLVELAQIWLSSADHECSGQHGESECIQEDESRPQFQRPSWCADRASVSLRLTDQISRILGSGTGTLAGRLLLSQISSRW
jgi:hypothetical protein